MSNSSEAWIGRFKVVADPRARLFCIPYAGGTSALFRPWLEHVPADLEICTVNFPGRGGRRFEPSCRRMPLLLAGIAEGMRPLLDVPYAVFGHSLGAVIAYELVTHLRQAGLPQPVRLFASGARGAQLPDPNPPIHHLPADQFIAQMQIRYEGIPQEVLAEPDLLALLLPPLQADLELFETYAFAAKPPLDCPIAVFGGLHDHRIGPPQYQAWRELTTRSVDVTMFEGGHFFVQQRAPEVARAVARILDRSLQGE